MAVKILYEDNHVIAVHKPAGTLVQAERKGDKNLFDLTKLYLKEKYGKKGNVFLGLVHRLDRPVEGIVIFAKTSKGASRLSKQFRDGTIKKIYRATVIGKPKKSQDTLIHYLKKDSNKKIALVSPIPKPGYQKAELRYKVISSKDNTTLMRIELKTGRFHQIRAQMAYIGHSILGDVKYGAPRYLSDKSIALCASELTFKLPTKEEYKTIRVNKLFFSVKKEGEL